LIDAHNLCNIFTKRHSEICPFKSGCTGRLRFTRRIVSGGLAWLDISIPVVKNDSEAGLEGRQTHAQERKLTFIAK